ncbi:unnamed protein product [Zymoseptoria tritici ST99CH_3D1]|nr:unnamed protein product [Zymoseptoria tritici ST99CH_3D1]
MASPTPPKTIHTTTYAAISPLLPSLSSSGKNILITGGGSGIGAEIAKAFALSGAASIALLGRTAASLEQTAHEISSTYPKTTVTAYVADITDLPALESSIAAHTRVHGPFHVLVANAGYLPAVSSLLTTPPDDWFQGFEVNVKGTFNLVRAFLPHATRNAVVLSTSTVVAHLSYVPGMSSYAASKLAAGKVFEYLHHEHPELFVLSVHPGMIRTGMADTALADGVVVTVPYDDVSLPASFMVWAASGEAKFLNGKSVWAAWDVEELKAEAEANRGSERFTLGLVGGEW